MPTCKSEPSSNSKRGKWWIVVASTVVLGVLGVALNWPVGYTVVYEETRGLSGARMSSSDLVRGGFPFRFFESVWSVNPRVTGYVFWSWAALIGNASVWGAVVGIWWNRHRFRLQHGVRFWQLTLFDFSIGSFVATLVLAMWTHEYRLWQHEERVAQALNSASRANYSIRAICVPSWLYQRHRSSGMWEYWEFIPHLRSVSIESPGPSFCWSDLAKCQALEDVEFRNNSATGESPVTDEALLACSQLTRLRSLKAPSPNISDHGAAQLDQLSELQFLDLSWGKLSDSSFSRISELTKLVFVEMQGVEVSDTGLAGLARLQDLRVLSVGQSSSHSNSGWDCFANHPNVEFLSIRTDVRKRETKPAVGGRILNLPKLQYLELPVNLDELTLHNLPQLKIPLPDRYLPASTWIPGSPVPKLGPIAKFLESERKFVRLNARRGGFRSSSGFEHPPLYAQRLELHDLPRLTQLKLRLDNPPNLKISNCPNLIDIQLWSEKSSSDENRGTQPIALPRMTAQLLNREANLTVLTVFAPADQLIDWSFVTEFTKLRALDVSDTSFSDKDVCHLSGLKRLRVLNVIRTKLSPTGNQACQNLVQLTMLFGRDKERDGVIQGHFPLLKYLPNERSLKNE